MRRRSRFRYRRRLVGDLHGSARATNDLDIFYSRDPANLRRLADALAPHHPRLRDLPTDLPFIWDVSTLRNASLLTLVTDLGMIDLLNEIAGLGTYSETKGTAVDVEAFGRRVYTLDLESLIRSKRAAGREKDLLAIPELESLRESSS